MICALCNENKPLKESHILPEFLYDLVYEPDHKFYVMSNDNNIKPSKKRKGIYEELMCGACEDIIEKYEDYAAKVLAGLSKDFKITEYEECFIVNGLDYKKFKLFQLSLIWRSSVSKRPEFENCNLNHHQEIIRKMIYEGNPGRSFEYGCVVYVIPNSEGIADSLVYPPEQLKDKIDGHRVFRAIFAGYCWIFYISSHLENFTHAEYFLSSDGNLPIAKAGPFGLNFLLEFSKDFSSKNKDFIKNKYGISY